MAHSITLLQQVEQNIPYYWNADILKKQVQVKNMTLKIITDQQQVS
jgi:hypothetical protein